MNLRRPYARAAVFFWVLCLRTVLTLEKAQAHSTIRRAVTYRAAAAQMAFSGSVHDTPAVFFQGMTQRILNHAKNASLQKAQVLVLPEGLLSWPGEVNGTRDTMEPYCVEADVGMSAPTSCSQREFLRSSLPLSVVARLACVAREFRLVLVAHMCVKEVCRQNTATASACPSDGRFQWSANVVFNETGSIIAVYRKSHLAGGSFTFDQPARPDVVAFWTSFGVRFGTMICYDMEFDEPMNSLRSLGVTDLLVPTSWVNTLPFFDALMLQQGLSREVGINLVAANNGGNGYVAGGGIYTAGQALDYFFDPTAVGVDRLTVADLTPGFVPPQPVRRQKRVAPPPAQAQAQALHLPQQTTCDFMGFTMACIIVEPQPQLYGKAVVKHKGLDCQVTFNFANDPGTRPYIAAALVMTYDPPGTPDAMGISACGFFQCEGAPHCKPFLANASALVTQVQIQGNFSGFNPSLRVLPQLSVGDAQLVKRSELFFVPFTNISNASFMMSTFEQERYLYSAALLGLRPGG